MAFLLLIAGGLVTSNNAGLAVPDWPTSFGSLVKMPRMVGGVKFEHGHRMVAEIVGLLSIIVAIWTWRVDRRSWMRALTVGAVLGVIVQGVIGGIGVRELLPPWVSVMHATFGQTMFCTLAAIAVFTSRSWLEEPQEKIPLEDSKVLIRHSWMLIGFLYLQLILGAAFRHMWTKWGPTGANIWPAHKIIHAFLYPHILNALLVAGLVLYVSIMALTRYSRIAHLRRLGMCLLSLLMVQILLGLTAYIARVINGENSVQPTLGLVTSTVAHLGVGALILALSFIFTIQAYRHRGEAASVLPFDRERKVVSA